MSHPRLAFFQGPNAPNQVAAFIGNFHRASDENYYLQVAQDATLFDRMVTQAGGITSWSASQKELRVYEHDITPYAQSRYYLEDRDEVAWEIATGFAQRMWEDYPLLNDPRHKTFLGTLEDAMFLQTMASVESMARRDGLAYIYRRASGLASEPLRRGDRTVSFSPIHRGQIPDTMIEKHRGEDPLLIQHGIERVVIESKDAAGKGVKTEVHGHRLYPVYRNQGRGFLWPTYDSLWYMKDLLFSLLMAQKQGNPIVVRVDAKWLELVGEDLTEPEMAKLRDDVKNQTAKIQSMGKGSYEPLKGLIVERAGATDLDDPTPTIRLLANKISLVAGIAAARIHGLETLTDDDRDDELTWMHSARKNGARPIYRFMLDVARLTGDVPVRTPGLPPQIRWPYGRLLNPREEAYVLGKSVSSLKQAAQTGRLLPPEIDEMFPKITQEFEPRFILPTPLDPNAEAALEAEDQKMDEEIEQRRSRRKEDDDDDE